MRRIVSVVHLSLVTPCDNKFSVFNILRAAESMCCLESVKLSSKMRVSDSFRSDLTSMGVLNFVDCSDVAWVASVLLEIFGVWI